ncbi:YCF48-related protein [Marinobacter sp. NFXS9]|uniref:WD40/YVTN/BNR-like repeat-containing protein n=1 Tax=Marinobacter sp. NFXS9 TaxID=2818433 RepID=UPI0032DFA417
MCTKDVIDDFRKCRLLSMRKAVAALALWLSVLLGMVPLAHAAGFADPLDTAAVQQSQSADHLPVQALAGLGGGQLIAVGMRGVILRSVDSGGTWHQVPAPVSSDLLDVCFASPKRGWVVGQDGVVLASTDGGRTWHKQFDGRELESLLNYYREDQRIDPERREELVRQLELNLGAGPVLPFLSVQFIDSDSGLASGPFGMLIASEDGGRHWRPAMHQIDNPDYLHLNAIARVGDHLFIASEQGIVFKAKADVRELHFEPRETGHVGSFFSIAGHDQVLLAGGLGGVLFGSHDGGDSWRPLATSLTQLVSNIEFDADSDRFTAVTTGGEVLSLSADLSDIQLRDSQAPMLYTDLVSLPGGGVVFAGIQGLRHDTQSAMLAQGDEQ